MLDRKLMGGDHRESVMLCDVLMLGSLGSLLVSAALLWLFVQIACTYHASNMAHVRRHGKDGDGDGGMVWLPSILPVWLVHCQHVWQLVIMLHFFHSL